MIPSKQLLRLFKAHFLIIPRLRLLTLDIRDELGVKVATLVDRASEPEELIHAEGCKSKTWPERKAHTIDLIKNAGRDMKLLSYAGKLANLRDIIRDYDRLEDGVWDLFNASLKLILKIPPQKNTISEHDPAFLIKSLLLCPIFV